MMKSVKKYSMMAMAAAVAVVGFAGSANAQPMHETRTVRVVETVRHEPVREAHYVKRGGVFDRLDINNNGVVSQWEYKARFGNSRQAMRGFYRADSNRNGSLSRAEVRAARGWLA